MTTLDALQQSGYGICAAEMSDLEAVLELVNTCSKALVGAEEFRLQDFRREWEAPGFDLSENTRLVFSREGKLIGYCDVWDLDVPLVVVSGWGRVHPKYKGQGVGSALLNWAEARARHSLVKAPPQARVVMMVEAPHLDICAQQMLSQAGFLLVRYNLRMVMDLDQFPQHASTHGKCPGVVLPPDIVIRTMTPDKEERAVFEMLREAFRDHWGYIERPLEQEFKQWMYYVRNDDRFDPSLWFLAVYGEEIVGASLCQGSARGDPQMGWVRTLAVRRDWRHRGIATALLRHSFEALRRRGKERVGLSVDAQNLTGATQLYQKIGMYPDPRYQLDIYEKELRPGIELRVQGL